MHYIVALGCFSFSSPNELSFRCLIIVHLWNDKVSEMHFPRFWEMRKYLHSYCSYAYDRTVPLTSYARTTSRTKKYAKGQKEANELVVVWLTVQRCENLSVPSKWVHGWSTIWKIVSQNNGLSWAMCIWRLQSVNHFYRLSVEQLVVFSTISVVVEIDDWRLHCWRRTFCVLMNSGVLSWPQREERFWMTLCFFVFIGKLGVSEILEFFTFLRSTEWANF